MTPVIFIWSTRRWSCQQLIQENLQVEDIFLGEISSVLDMWSLRCSQTIQVEMSGIGEWVWTCYNVMSPQCRDDEWNLQGSAYKEKRGDQSFHIPFSLYIYYIFRLCHFFLTCRIFQTSEKNGEMLYNSLIHTCMCMCEFLKRKPLFFASIILIPQCISLPEKDF